MAGAARERKDHGDCSKENSTESHSKRALSIRELPEYQCPDQIVASCIHHEACGGGILRAKRHQRRTWCKGPIIQCGAWPYLCG